MAHPPVTIALPGIPPHRLLHVPGGEFRMGSADDDPDAYDDEKPAHPVRLDDFFIGEFLVTQDLWEAVMSKNPSHFQGPRRPVEQVSWNDIEQKFLPRLREKTGQAFRLPTEAEWEYAAWGGPYSLPIGEGRGGAEDYRYAGSDRLEQVGWYAANSGGESRPVGLLLPNALGLYDMSGNVGEWCADWYDKNYYTVCKENGVVHNPVGPDRASARVRRGGSWYFTAQYCRAACRYTGAPADRNLIIGFRLALQL